MRVWITRSEPGASRAAARLTAAGYQSLVAPVLAIARVPDAVLDAGAVDDVIFLSEHAVKPGLALLQAAGLTPSALRTFAIGPHTASCLADFGMRALVPPVTTSEGLLAMSQLAVVAGRRVVIFAGAGGREQLRQGLEQRGARVTRLALYRRVQVPVDDVCDAIEPAQIGAIAVSSGDGFRWAAQVWFAARGRREVAVFTPSERVTRMADGLGFSCAYTCRGADADALIDGLANFAG